MWFDVLGETFTVWYRSKNQDDPTEMPSEMYVLASELIAAGIDERRYPVYRLSSPAYYWSKDQQFKYWQIMHVKEQPWHGHSGFNKSMLAAELITPGSGHRCIRQLT